MKRQIGFSLIEMLVVVGIIATLAAIVLAVVAAAKKRGHVASCIVQQRQLVAALLQYSADNDGRLPRFLGEATETYKAQDIMFCTADPYVEKGGLFYFVQTYGGELLKSDPPHDRTSYWYVYGDAGQLQDDEGRGEISFAEEFPALTVCLAHQPNPSPLALTERIDGLVVRGMRDGSVQCRPMRTRHGISSLKLFGK